MTYNKVETIETPNILDKIRAERAGVLPFGLGTASVPAPLLTRPKKAKPAGPRTPAKEEPEKAPRKKEPNITERVALDGRKSWRVQIRSRKNGHVQSLCETFSTEAAAKKWRNRKLLEIADKGFPVRISRGKTVKHLIEARLKVEGLGRSTKQMLTTLQECEISKVRVSDLMQKDIFDLADELQTEDRKQQTVTAYMSTLASLLKRAAKREPLITAGVVEVAMSVLWEDHVLARSEERERRPSLDELERLLTLTMANPRQGLPIAKIVLFAIFSTRRLGEICRLRWDDLRIGKPEILVRDMKDPRRKRGNNVWCDLPPEALRLVQSMPRASELIFPYNSKSVGTAFRRHCKRAGIRDLHFHDLRHEGITRQFEIGKTAPFVARISGHKRFTTLERYTHVDLVGDRYDGWPWVERILSDGAQPR